MIKYLFDENIFSVINTFEKAYWVGFLYARWLYNSIGKFWMRITRKR